MSYRLRNCLVLVALLLTTLPLSKSNAADVRLGYGWSVKPKEAKAVEEALVMMRKTITKPSLIILLTESSYDNDEVIAHELRAATNNAKVFGIEGTYAVFSGDGIHVGKKGSLALLGIEAPAWNIGVGVTDMSTAKTPTQIKEKSMQAIEAAIQDAGKTKEDEPTLILIAPTKVKEEPILETIEYVFGKNVRIAGGTPGGPNVTANAKVVKNGFAISVIYADTKIGTGFHAGIAIDKSKSGVVTAMGANRRVINEIDGKPAFEVYRGWTEGAFDDVHPEKSPAIWSRSFALVRVFNLSDNQIGEKVVVPIKVNPDFSMITGADVCEGERLYFATATKKAYIKRAGTIVQRSLVEGKIKLSNLAGGIHFYCRGAAFSQFGKNEKHLQVLVRETNKKMRGKPYIGTFTAGEQGNISGYGIFMGNLSSAMAVFGK